MDISEAASKIGRPRNDAVNETGEFIAPARSHRQKQTVGYAALAATAIETRELSGHYPNLARWLSPPMCWSVLSELGRILQSEPGRFEKICSLLDQYAPKKAKAAEALLRYWRLNPEELES